MLQPLGASAQSLGDVQIQNLLQTLSADTVQSLPSEDVRIGPPSSATTQRFASRLGVVPALGAAEKVALLRQKVKYVFVLFQENRAFDFYFGTFPGAHG
ncbi:MAG: hypothetical protein ACRYHQ_16210, partial [Janthinobacterium lividum]